MFDIFALRELLKIMVESNMILAMLARTY